jgi:enamine deaminase RidA (YjgF/YER057c/UK114 family)
MPDRKELMVDGLAPPISHYCDAVRFGDLLFISGVPPPTPPAAWSAATTWRRRRGRCSST